MRVIYISVEQRQQHTKTTNCPDFGGIYSEVRTKRTIWCMRCIMNEWQCVSVHIEMGHRTFPFCVKKHTRVRLLHEEW